MNNININFKVSPEILIDIINCINNIKLHINEIINRIDMINKDGTWNSNSSELIKNIFVDRLSFYLKECDDMDLLVKKLIDNLENYMQLDEQVLKVVKE